MRAIVALMLAFSCQAAAAADIPAFYVVDMRHEGSAALHATIRGVAAGTALPYVLTDPTTRMACCFRVGSKPGARTAPVEARTESAILSADEGEPVFEFSGYLAGNGAMGAGSGDIGFGIVGMTGVRPIGKDGWEITRGAGAGVVIVRQCTGIEGLHFRLYRGRSDRKPLADYYFALGYDTEPTCR
jgi:hypothetical protein